MNSKELLLQDKATSAWWNSVTKNPAFPTILLMARSDLADWDDIKEIAGARKMLQLLETFAENPLSPKKPLTAGLKHDFKPNK